MKPRTRTHRTSFRASLWASGLVMALAGPTAALAANPTIFTPFNQPIGVAASQNRLFVSSYCGPTTDIYSLDSAGNSTLFASIPRTANLCIENYLAISPGLGGFPPNYIYVTSESSVYQIPPSGTPITNFVTIPSLPNTHVGITFDHVGNYGFDMLIAGGPSGEVWRVNSLAQATQLATISGAFVEGPDVAPASFAPYGGQLLLASENNSAVYAVSPSGAVSTVVSFPAAESMHVIPPKVCSFGQSGGAFFSAIYPTQIEMFPPSDFAGLGGQVLVTSEGSAGIGLLTSTGSGISITTFQTFIGQFEGSTFVDCAVPPPTEICDNGVDDDGDGLIDSQDPDCQPLAITLASFKAEAGTRSIKLSWATASEMDNAGFTLLRGESASGPFHPVTAGLIPSKGSSASGATYTFEDHLVRRRKAYYYVLVDVDLNGVRTEHGPVSASVGSPRAERRRR